MDSQSVSLQKHKPKAIVFDLLTALLDSWSLWNLAAGSASLGHAWRAHYLSLTYGCGAYRPYEELVSDSAALTPGLPATAAADLVAAWDKLAPWPEVPGVLARLRERGYALAVLTNCSAELGRRAAGRCGEGFDVVVTAEEAGFYKPHPAAYAKVLEVLGITAEDALFVAGSAADVPGAAAAGMRVVWHNRIGLARKPGPEPEKEARTLGEVLEGVVL
jgi:2-haloacid dehalogenase